ncbi:MAG TPA: flagellar assembly protein FliW [Ruminiclostridium sp.]|nr:flagellar assembly protein FliW [Ruminiclostridium sp.]
MIITTKDLGNVEIAEQDIVKFPHGLYGFKNKKNFVVLSDNNDENPFMWLQSTDSREPRFVVIDPVKIFNNYYVPIESAKSLIPIENETDMRFLAITTVTKGAHEIYVNLKCPIVINARRNIAAQIILDSEDYPIRYYLVKKEG